MQLVVDASAIVQVSLAGGELGPLWAHDLVAPPLLAAEVTSILCEMAYRGDVPPDQARVAVTNFAALTIRYDRAADHAERAFDLARSLGWAKTYDAEYVVLAQTLDVPLFTIDERLRRGAGHLVPMPTPIELNLPDVPR